MIGVKKLRFPDSKLVRIGRETMHVNPTVKALADVEWKGSDGNVLSAASDAQDNSIIRWDSTNKKYQAKPLELADISSLITTVYEYIRVGMDYNQSAGTLAMMLLDGGTRPKTTFAGSLENCCMIAPHDGTLEFISFRSEEVAGSTVMGFHKASDGTEVPSDTPTTSVTVDMSGVADDTTTKFAFTSSNTFSAGDVLGFSIDPANDINDCLFVICLKYDTTT